MHRDKKVALALSILLLGIVAAFFFPRNPEPLDDPPLLENAERLDQRIAARPGAPYIPDLPDRPDSAELSGDNEEFRQFPTSSYEGIPPYETQNENSTNQPESRRGSRHDSNPNIPEPSEAIPPPLPPVRSVAGSRLENAVPIPVDPGLTDGVSGSKSPAPLRPRPRLGRFIIHEVRDGETLSKLAGRYLQSTSLFNEIYRVNRDVLKDPNSIRPGMKLKIPIKSNGKQNTLRTTSAKTGKSKKSVAASKLGTAGSSDSSRNQTAGKKSSGKSRVKRFTQVPPSDLPPQ